MNQAFKAYVRYMDEVDKKDPIIAESPSLVSQWQTIMKAFKTTCESWWRGLQLLPDVADLKRLKALLKEVCTAKSDAHADDGAQTTIADAPRDKNIQNCEVPTTPCPHHCRPPPLLACTTVGRTTVGPHCRPAPL